MTTRYLVDNNALIALKRDRVASDFFRDKCQVTTDVLFEAAEHPHFTRLKMGAYPLTPSVLEQIRAVMATVQVGDTSVIDLYGNKGTADPGLVASALDAAGASDGTLFHEEWIIVTNDKGVEHAAGQHGVGTIKPAELAALIDEVG